MVDSQLDGVTRGTPVLLARYHDSLERAYIGPLEEASNGSVILSRAYCLERISIDSRGVFYLPSFTLVETGLEDAVHARRKPFCGSISSFKDIFVGRRLIRERLGRDPFFRGLTPYLAPYLVRT